MKKSIHPEYVEAEVTCSCGNKFETHATKADIHVEICSNCHPFYTGKQKLVDAGGRVQRFKKKYGDVKLVPEEPKVEEEIEGKVEAKPEETEETKEE